MPGREAQAAQSKLRILYVGTDPKTVQPSDRQGDNAQRRADLLKSRAPAFETLLREHFTTVNVVYSPQYNEALSAKHDVTIFDATPPATTKQRLETDAAGKPVRLYPASYLSPAFDRPAILIGQTSAEISEGMRGKMDWLCLCLDAHAHHAKFQHPIFDTPNKIKPTLEYRPAPDAYRMHEGTGLPDTLPMWRVQTEGYGDGKGMEIGLVASGPGFEDGGDAEIISGGVNTKDMHAVALGRHGNFFHWGFAAAPDYMTPDAQLAFINAVHYIAGFKGQRPYSHRDYRVYARFMAVQISGALSGPRAESALQLMPESMVSKFGKDYGKYRPYYQENIDYIVTGPRPVTYEVDEDARSLGIPNHDPQILELSVTMLENNFDTSKATRVLTRYTGEKFQTAAQWRKWLDANRSRLYFSDVDGFRYHLRPVK